MRDNISPVVKELSKKFGFSYKRALIFLGIIKIKCLLPYDGKERDTCKAIRWAYGLHTQCKNPRLEDNRYCYKCALNYEKKTLVGDIEERKKVGFLDYVDRKGRKTIPWCNYIQNKKLNKERCLEYAVSVGFNILKEHLEVSGRGRGRPKKKRKIIRTKQITDFLKEQEYIEVNNLGKTVNGEAYKLYDFGAVKIN